MRIFPHFNPAGDSICPICGTSEDKETVLVPIAETWEGNICQGAQVHSECIEANWFYHEEQNFIGVACLCKTTRPESA